MDISLLVPMQGVPMQGVPLQGGLGHPGLHMDGGPPFFAPFLGLPLFLLLAAGLFFLLRRGVLRLPPEARHRSPEHEAKRVLAERFASGDLSSDEFLERASVLNWTPGSEGWETRKRKRR